MLGKLLRAVYRSIVDESGQGVAEYVGVLAFAAGLMAVLVTNQTYISIAIVNAFNSIRNTLNSLISGS